MAILKFAKNSYKSPSAVKKLIDYIQDPKKTTPEIGGGAFCGNDSETYKEFMSIKKMWGKTTGRQLVHLTLNFDPKDKITPQEAKDFAEDFLKHPQFSGFQVTFQVHTDKDHMHIHFIINTVNVETGNKWQQNLKDLESLKQYLDQMCQERGLYTLEESQERIKNDPQVDEKRRKVEERRDKDELVKAIALASCYSRSKREFFVNMKKLGYTALWHDGERVLKFVTPTKKRYEIGQIRQFREAYKAYQEGRQIKPLVKETKLSFDDFCKSHLDAVFKFNAEKSDFNYAEFEKIAKDMDKLREDNVVEPLDYYYHYFDDIKKIFEEFGLSEKNESPAPTQGFNYMPFIYFLRLLESKDNQGRNTQSMKRGKNRSKEDKMHFRKNLEKGKGFDWER